MDNGKLVLKGNIELISPLTIGGGENEESDLDVIKDEQEVPFIPATSFVGVLRHFIKLDKKYENDLDKFWGNSENKNRFGSSVSCSDLILNNEFNLNIRDGVKIDNKTGRAEDQGKFDYEVIEPGAKFSLKLVVDYKKAEQKEFTGKMFDTIIDILSNKELRIGAKTNSGLGKIKLYDYKVFDYDFADKKKVFAWLSNNDIENTKTYEKFDINHKHFIIDAYFDLKTSLIIKSYPTNPNSPDSVHIKSNGKNILPGTSVKGAVRARAERILNTKFRNNNFKKIFDELFGFVNENDPNSKPIKSKLRIEESILRADKFAEEIQTRIKIDRFTGGTMSGALFDSMPLFRKDKDKNEKVINAKMTIRDYTDYEAGLLLLVLKDLWTGDLPLGGEKNIGRGVLEGVFAEIKNGNGLNIQVNNLSDLTEDGKNKLQHFVNALNSEVKNGN